jgi:5,10-methylenetetrahydromethanopterin reductase
MKIGWLTLGNHSRDDLINMAQTCEGSGFDTFWIADERFFMETYSSLTLCATGTSHICLGTGVTDPFSRHPALTAMAIGTVDNFSNGRAVLGLGAGNSGFRELFIKREKAAQAIREAVMVIRRLLAGEKVTLDGQVIKLQNCQLGFKPLRQVPIVVASNGQLIIQVAGEIADGVISSSVLDQSRVDEVLELVDKGLKNSNRKRSQLTIWSRLNIAVNNDLDRSYQALKPNVYNLICGKYPDTGMFDRMGLHLSNDLRQIVETVGNTRDSEKLANIVKLMPDEFVQKTCLVGKPNTIAQQLLKLEKAGFDGVILYPVTTEGQSIFDILRIVIDEILPVLRNNISANNVNLD